MTIRGLIKGLRPEKCGRTRYKRLGLTTGWDVCKEIWHNPDISKDVRHSGLEGLCCMAVFGRRHSRICHSGLDPEGSPQNVAF